MAPLDPCQPPNAPSQATSVNCSPRQLRGLPSPPLAQTSNLIFDRIYSPDFGFVFVCLHVFRQPAARRANIDFERSERERIHFETATRVMNYEIQAQRAEVAANKELLPKDGYDGQLTPVVVSFSLSYILCFGALVHALLYVRGSSR